jgi:hypothetical protein
MSVTPSPCLRWCSTSGLSGSTAPLTTKRIEPEPQHERLVVAVAVLRAGVRLELHPPRGLVVVRRLGRVADAEDDRVPAGDREDVALLVVLDQADELLELVDGEVGLELVLGERAAGAGGLASRRHGSYRCPAQGRVCNSTMKR